MTTTFFAEVAAAEAHGTRACLVTVVAARGSTPRKAGAKMLVYPDKKTCGTIGGGGVEKILIDKAADMCATAHAPVLFTYALDGTVDTKDKMICGGEMTFFLEVIGQARHLHIFGGGHCGIAVYELAVRTGYITHIYDDRPDIAHVDRFPRAATVQCGAYEDMAATLVTHPQDCIVIMTQGHTADESVLHRVLRKKAAYIGLMASKKKRADLFAFLAEKGCTEEELARVHAPVGLHIGAETPEEIAVSIMAEIIAVTRHTQDATDDTSSDAAGT